MKRFQKTLLIFLLAQLLLGCAVFNPTSQTTIPKTTTSVTSTQTSSSNTELSTESELTIRLRSIFQLSVETGAFEGTYEEWLETVRGPQGVAGREVVFQVSDGYIQWQYIGDTTWTNLISLSTLTGANGSNGTDGVNGKEVLFQVSDGYIQWQYIGDTTWTNLISLSTLTGASGSNGTDGVDGLSAYQIYLLYHPEYVGTEENWINDLINGNLGGQQTYTVTFDSDGGTPVENQTILNNHKARVPSEPTKDGYSFDGWYINGFERWVFGGYNVTENITLVAHWIINHYNVVLIDESIVLDNHSFYSEYNEVIKLPIIQKDGYRFRGWQSNDGEIYTDEYLVTGEAVLTALWDEDEIYEVTFISYNNATETVLVLGGTNIQNREPLVDEYELNDQVYGFVGWDKSLSSISSDITVNALYSEQNLLKEGYMFTTGNPKIAVIIVYFNHQTQFAQTYEQIVQSFFDQDGKYGIKPSNSSLRSFLYNASYGKLDISGEVFTYTTIHQMEYYTTTSMIIDEVINEYGNLIDWSQFDSNNDNFVDGIYICPTIMPINAPSGSFVKTYNGNLNGYQFSKLVYSASSSPLVLAHETIHLIGLPDIYANVGVNPGGTMANTIMDGFADVAGIMKYLYGWIDNPIFITGEGTFNVTLQSLSTHGNLLIVPANGDISNPNWFIIEYITKELNNSIVFSEDQYSGIRIWRANMIYNDGEFEIELFLRGSLMDSPYEYLEAVHDGAEFYFTEGMEFTPYSNLESWYGMRYVLIGNQRIVSEKGFSGISMTDIVTTNEGVSFTLSINNTPSAESIETFVDTSQDMSVITLPVSGIYICKILFSSSLVMDGNVYIVNQDTQERFSILATLGSDQKTLYISINSDVFDQIDRSAIYTIDFGGSLYTYWGQPIIGVTADLSLTGILPKIELLKSVSDLDNFYRYPTDSVTFRSIDENTLIALLLNKTYWGTDIETPAFAFYMHFVDAGTGVKIVLENQIDTLISSGSDIDEYYFEVIENGNILIYVRIGEEQYFDLYDRNGTRIDHCSLTISHPSGGVYDYLGYIENTIFIQNTSYDTGITQITKITVVSNSIEVVTPSLEVQYRIITFVNEYDFLLFYNEGIYLYHEGKLSVICEIERMVSARSLLSTTIHGDKLYLLGSVMNESYSFHSLILLEIDLITYEANVHYLESLNHSLFSSFPQQLAIQMDESNRYIISFVGRPVSSISGFLNSYIIVLDQSFIPVTFYRYGDSYTEDVHKYLYSGEGIIISSNNDSYDILSVSSNLN
jgi:M6 family metalloprotease-like protein/uncharacterized repeat protein (TIGR02543 family)